MMNVWLASPWQIVLSAAIPVAIALILFVIEKHGPLARPIQASTGLVAPYFTSVAIIFGLFAALLANDAWQKDNRARAAVQAEADALHFIAHLSRATGIQDAVLPDLRAYIAAASAEDPYSANIETSRGVTGQAFQKILTTIVGAPGIEPIVRDSLLAGARDLLRAHDDRLHLATDEAALLKWLSIIVLGAITQIALLLVHVTNRRAHRIAVGLFTVAFGFCLVVVAIFDTPFETVLADQPRKTLSLVLRSL